MDKQVQKEKELSELQKAKVALLSDSYWRWLMISLLTYALLECKVYLQIAWNMFSINLFPWLPPLWGHVYLCSWALCEIVHSGVCTMWISHYACKYTCAVYKMLFVLLRCLKTNRFEIPIVPESVTLNSLLLLPLKHCHLHGRYKTLSGSIEKKSWN